MIKSISACCKYLFALVIACMMAQPASALTFAMDTVSGAPSDTVTVSVRVYDFTDLIAIQGTIQFDPVVASFVQITSFGLPGLGAANFGTTQSASGKVTFSWDDATLSGVTINDVVIFAVKLKLVGAGGQQSPVTFANSPTVLEFSDITFNTVGSFTLNDGLIEISGAGDPCAGITCDDTDACTTDTCIAGTCEFTPIICDDGDACTIDTCADGICFDVPISCNDDDACTSDQCSAGTCTNTPAFCDDGDACTIDDCDSITGCTITVVVCDDGDNCTTDGCDITSGCTTAPVNCDDNDACTTDSCDSGSCINSIIPGCNDPCDTLVCDDADLCTTDTCLAGACDFTAIVCDDGDDCTTDTCDAGVCAFNPVNCDDGDDCTTDICVGTCQNTPMDCDDGDACTTDDCVAGVCDYTTVVCDDGDACTTDTCDAGTGCTTTTLVCDDGDDCTTDACDAIDGCTATPVNCDDADACTTDSCDGGSCINSIIPGCNDPCDTLVCDDADACTTDSCNNGACEFSAIVCDDSDNCTDDACVNGVCEFTQTVCDDGDDCTTDACDAIDGCTATPVNCDDADACTTDSCAGGSCINTTIPGCNDACDTLICDDADLCTTDTCSNGSCSYTPIDCTDSDDCTTDFCDLGSCDHLPVTCDDTDDCTTDECIGGSCEFTPIDCSDADDCTTDDCVGGTCSNSPITCDDGDQCTIDACANGICSNADTCTVSGLRLAMDQVSGAQGADVVLPVRAYGFTDIIAIQGTIQFDPAVAAFVSMEAYGLPGLGVANFGTTQVAGGKLTFSWDDATLSGVTVPSGTEIFSIRFNLVGNDGESTITSFVNTPTIMEFTDVNFNSVTATLDEGLIEITGGLCTGVDCNDNDACTTDTCDSGNCINTSIVCNDGNACTTDSCDIASGCTTTQLICDDGDDCTTDACDVLTGCTATAVNCDDGDVCTTDSCANGGCINTVIPGCSDPCLSLNCDDADDCTTDTCSNGTCSNTPINCDDGDDCTTDGCDLGSCFNNPIVCDDADDCTTDTCVGGACKFTPVNCDDGDDCTTDFCDLGSCDNSPVSCDDGDQCTIDACANGLCSNIDTCSSGLRLAMDMVSGAQGADVIMPVKAYGFTDIIAIQGTIQFDPAVAAFVSMEAYGLPGLTAANFGTTQAASGIITFSWDDATLSGVSVSNATEIFSIRFNLMGNSGEQTTTDFISTPTLLEFVDVNFNTVPATLDNGLIEITGPPSHSITTSNISPTTYCAGTSVNVDFTKTGTFDPGNVFTAQLSDENGSFSNPVDIGSITDTAAATISATIPSNTITGSYRIRVLSSTPAVTGTDNGSDLTVNAAVTPDVIISASNTSSCPGDNVTFGATPVNGGATPTYDWMVNGTSAGVNTDLFSTNTLNDNDIVTVKITSSDACASPVTAVSNSIMMTISSSLVASVSITSNAIDVCSGEEVTFTAIPRNGGALPVYDWMVNGTSTGNTSEVFSSMTLNSGDDVNVEMTSSLSCANPDSATSNSISLTVIPSVTASVSIAASTTSVCSGENVTFLATSVNEGTNPTYQWKVNGVNEGTNAFDFASTTLNDGDTVTVEMTSSEQCATPSPAISNEIIMTVAPSDTPLVSITASTTSVCTGENVEFTAVAVNGGTAPSYQWMVNGGNEGTDSDTFSSTALADNDVVSVMLTSNSACAIPNTAVSNDITMTVASSLTPTATITASSTSICRGDNVTFNATATSGGATPSFQWMLNGNDVGTNSETYSSDTLDDNDEVSVMLVSSLSCADPDTVSSNTLTISLAAAVMPSVSIVASETDICAGISVTFTATPVNGGVAPDYQWMVNGNNEGTNSDVFTSTTLGDNDAVSVEMTSSSSCASPSSVTSNVITINVSALITPSVSITTPSTIACVNDNVKFTATPVNGGASPDYQWMVNGTGVGPNSNEFTSIVNDGDLVQVEMTSNDACATSGAVSSNAITMSVVTTITPSVTITVNANNVCLGSKVTFTASPVNGGAAPSYQWKIDNIDVGPNAPQLLTPFITNGSQVILEMSSSYSCATPPVVTSNMITMTVGAPVTTTISGLNAEYCVDAAAQTMNGMPLGGSFTGPGVSGTKFVPYDAGPGVYLIGYSFQSPLGCTAITSEVVTVHKLPTVNFDTLDNKYCSLQQTVSLTGTPAGGWFTGNSVDSFGVFTVPTVNNTLSIPITYSYRDSNSCKGTITKATTINPVVTPVLVGVSKDYCENQNAVSLAAVPAGGMFTGAGVTGNTLDPTVAGTGAHTLEYIYMDGNNCPNKVTETITVNQPPQVSVTIASSFCFNDPPVQLQGTPTGGVFSSTDQSGANVVNGGFFSPNNGSPDSTYTVKYSYTDNKQCSNLATEDVLILSPPFVEFEMTDNTFCSHETSVFLDVNIPGGTYYGAGITGDTFNPSAVGPGEYFIAYYLTNQSGCTGSAKTTLKVDACTGIAEEESIAIVVYPNPSEGIFILENMSSSGSDVRLEVFSIDGKLLMDREIYQQGSKERLDLSGYAEGMYLLKLHFGDVMMLKRVVVSR